MLRSDVKQAAERLVKCVWPDITVSKHKDDIFWVSQKVNEFIAIIEAECNETYKIEGKEE